MKQKNKKFNSLYFFTQGLFLILMLLGFLSFINPIAVSAVGVGSACTAALDCGGNHLTCLNNVCKIGTLSNECSVVVVSCQEGLICRQNNGDPNYHCLQAYTAPATPENLAPGTEATGKTDEAVSCDTSGKDGCPVGLCKVNGICLPPSEFKTGVAGATTLNGLILTVVQLMLAFAGLIAVVFIIIGGYYYMSSGGNEENAEKGKSIITNFVIGLVIIILAYAIVTILIATLTGQDKLLKK
jgi:hypothetical protein